MILPYPLIPGVKLGREERGELESEEREGEERRTRWEKKFTLFA